jgi:hypothetical protein
MWSHDMPKRLIKFAIAAAVAAVSAGFSSAEFESSAYRGEPLYATLVRLGPPIQTAYVEGQRIYYWRVIYPRGRICKIWCAVRHHIVVNWGYQDCT